MLKMHWIMLSCPFKRHVNTHLCAVFRRSPFTFSNYFLQLQKKHDTKMLIFYQRNSKSTSCPKLCWMSKCEHSSLFSELSHKVNKKRSSSLSRPLSSEESHTHTTVTGAHDNPMSAFCSYTKSQHESTTQGACVPTCSLPAWAWSTLSTQRDFSCHRRGTVWLDQMQKCHFGLHGGSDSGKHRNKTNKNRLEWLSVQLSLTFTWCHGPYLLLW